MASAAVAAAVVAAAAVAVVRRRWNLLKPRFSLTLKKVRGVVLTGPSTNERKKE